MEQAHPELNIIRLKENKGLGNALNIGIRQCKNELVARMDTDDISRANRCEKQLSVFALFPEISICSGTVEEFSESRSRIEARRVLPEKQEDILAFAKKRNPFNHPCVMYKKSDVEAAGSYQVFYRVEDYYLWIRMLRMGFEGYNIQEPLLWMRAGSDMYKRRGGWKFAQSQIKLFRYMKDNSFINRRQYAENIVLRYVECFIPNALREKAFKMFVRN
jgi:glycosyltransferase involved in cell wall biosynthesis